MIKIIALITVMVVVNLFMIFAVIKASEKTKDTVVDYFVRKTSELEAASDDFALLGKETDIPGQDVQPQIIYVEKHGSSELSQNDDVTTAKYKQKDFKNDYKRMKGDMDFDKEEILGNLIAETEDEAIDEIVHLAFEVEEKLSFDNIFKLSSLPSEDQEMAIGSALSEEEEKLIDLYFESEKPAEFSAVGFYNFILQLTKVNDPDYIVRTGWKSEDYSNMGDDVITVFDDSITEGIKVIRGNKLYDYSI